MELHINVGYEVLLYETLWFILFDKQPLYLVVVLKAVSKIKAFTILIGFRILYRESAVLKNIYFLSSLLLSFSKFTLSLLVARC
jgi:hypothetical protein